MIEKQGTWFSTRQAGVDKNDELLMGEVDEGKKTDEQKQVAKERQALLSLSWLIGSKKRSEPTSQRTKYQNNPVGGSCQKSI